MNNQSASTDFIILTSGRWDNAYSSTIFSLAQEIAKQHRVFFVDHPFTWKDYYQHCDAQYMQRRRSALLHGKDPYHTVGHQLVAVTTRLMLPINWLPPGRFYNALANINERIFARCIKKLLADYDIHDYVFINSFLPHYFRKFPPFFRPQQFVYQTVDDMRHAPYLNKHGAYLEDQTIRRADITLTTSTELYRLKKPLSRRIHVVPNAANIALFGTAYHDELPVPTELAKETRPIITYVGNTIADRTDFDVLRQMAQHHTDKLLLMIGPYEASPVQASGLLDLPNVRFLGPRPIDEIPAYLQHAHCAIIPFLCNPLTKSIYPLKINEYLAAGKPVVTTPFSEDILSFKHIYVASSGESFARQVGIALAEDDTQRQQQRVAEAKSNSWERRAAQLLDIVQQTT